MKYLILTCLLATAFAAQVPTCDECIESMGRWPFFNSFPDHVTYQFTIPPPGKLVTRLMSPESLRVQIGALVPAICPEAPEPAHCEESLAKTWPDIGHAMYPVFLEGSSVCTQLIEGGCLVRCVSWILLQDMPTSCLTTLLQGVDL